MQTPDPKKDQSKVVGSTSGTAYPLDKYTVSPKNAGSDAGNKSPYYQSQAPTISMPKGGGALKSIDEKFTVNAVNGSSSMQVPLPFSQGRGGFTPSLALQYNSGSGNSEFGLGWSLSLPAIQRKTDKKLPQYDDANESDVFIMAGAEDLQPLLVLDEGDWIHDISIYGDFVIKKYRPRVEGLFARIDWIKNTASAGSYWKVTTKDNVVTFYGYTAEARVSDPENEGRIYKWLPQVSYDNKGNVMRYFYVSDTGGDIVPAGLHERNRKNGLAPFTQTYLSHVAYCNKAPYLIESSTDPIVTIDLPVVEDFLMRCVLDYGGHTTEITSDEPTLAIPSRVDAFSDFHAGFEIRTYRRCVRVIMFHYFDELDEGSPVAVRSIDMDYTLGAEPDGYAEADQVQAITQKGYIKTLSGYSIQSLPPLVFEYSGIAWNKEIKNISPVDLENAPQGLSGSYQWIDLWGNGLPGFLTEQANAWYYKENKGDGHFGAAVRVAEKPSLQGLGSGLQWQDLDANGSRQLVSKNNLMPGYMELNDEQQWQPFKAFKDWIHVDWDSPYTRMLDLNGDGRPDLLLTEDMVWKWYENTGTAGYKEGGYGHSSHDEERGPRLLHSDMVQSIFLADMNGDGLTDIVRVQNGEVCYWPNMGYGKFGARVTMSNSPRFGSPDLYNPQRIILTDITGTGAVDILFFGYDKCTAWLNLSGNAWGEAVALPAFAGAEQMSKVTAMDLLGKGTSCLVWSSPLPGNATMPMRYIDIAGTQGKPYLLKSYSNSMGKRIEINYKQSTYFYLQDMKAGTPWATRLPFPVQCVEKQTIYDLIGSTESVARQTEYVTRYEYHHGYYDHDEREFRGFGRVDTYDTDVASAFTPAGSEVADLNQAPVKTKTWYHTGAWMRERTLLEAFSEEYCSIGGYAGLPAYTEIPSGLTAQEQREAYRALKGMPLRQEVYALDGSDLEATPYTITTNTYCVKLVQPKATNNFASFYSYKQQTLAFSCERNADDPRLLHDLTLVIDDYGNILSAARVAYPRRSSAIPSGTPSTVSTEQSKMLITFTNTAYTNDTISNYSYLLRLPYDVQVFELTGTEPDDDLWTVSELASVIDDEGTGTLTYIDTATTGAEKRLLSHQRTTYIDTGAGALALGTITSLNIPYRQYALAFTDDMLSSSAWYDGRVDSTILAEGAYVSEDDIAEFSSTDDSRYWLSGGTITYDTTHFYTPTAYQDPWGNETTIAYWDDAGTNYYLLPQSVTDAVGNTTTVNAYNWYNLQPTHITDINNNQTHILYDALGLPLAVAVMEKDGTTTGDTLSGIDPADTSGFDDFFSDPVTYAPDMIAGASWRCVYKFGDDTTPSCVAMIARQQHNSTDPDSPLLIRLTYTDGLGRVAMHKVQAAPTDTEGDTTIRWIASGKTIYNNKGNPVMQFEPYYATSHAFDNTEAAEAAGVSPRMHYDPLGRLIRTDLPDGTYTLNVWDAWKHQVWDGNDTVADSDWYTAASTGTDEEQDAANKAAEHAATPTTIHLDTLARPFYTIQHNRTATSWGDEYYHSHTVLDIQGLRRSIHDARGHTTITYTYNMLQAAAKQVGLDSGTQYLLADAAGQPIYSWGPTMTSTEVQYHHTYDELRRLLTKEIDTNIVEQMEYGEGATDAADHNLNGMVWKIYDGFAVHTLGYDFTGNKTEEEFSIIDDPTITFVDWGGTVAHGTITMTSITTYDALGRPETITDTDGNITRNEYNESGQLYAVYLTQYGGSEIAYIEEIHYNAKGQREIVYFGNSTNTAYEYDPNTFRVTRITTMKGSDKYQDLYYWYDPVGNITTVLDDAQRALIFANSVILPEQSYTYDALYRLIEANGREQKGTATFGSNDNTDDHYWMIGLSTPDDNQTQNYTQKYEYDPVGNITKMQHIAGVGSYTRNYNYSSTSNLLTSTVVGSSTYNYTYHDNGVLKSAPHLSNLNYYCESRLAEASLGGGGTAYYQYDYNGQRARKTIVNGAVVKETIYLGNYELYEKRTSGTADIQRTTVHINDDTGRIAMWELRTIGTEVAPASLVRFIYNNHLGTACLELDDSGAMISYEEYHPYGTTSFQNLDATIRPNVKRYRFVNKERDDETGFYYIGARYYCPWLARWLAPDPINSEWYNITHGTPNRSKERHFLELTASGYEYCHANPIRFIDPTGEQHVPPELTESGAARIQDAAAKSKPAQDNLQSQAKPLTAGKDYIPSTPLEKGLTNWHAAHPGQALPSGGSAETMSESRLQKMTPEERKEHEQIRAQKLELAGYKPNGEPTGATKLVQNKHWQGLANNLVLPTLEVASVLDGASIVKNVIFKETSNTGLKAIFGKTGMESFMASANNPVKQQGLTEVGRALQKHVGREGSVFEGLEFSHKTANEVGLNVLSDILKSENQLIRPATQGGHEIFDLTTGRGVGVSRGGLFNGFREFSK